MKRFFAYLWRQRWPLLLFILCAALFLGVLALYQAPLEGAIYGTLLCLLVAAASFVAGFLRYRKKQLYLEALLPRLNDAPPVLPEPADGVEEGYQRIIQALDGEKRQIAADAAGARDRTETFYTVWAHQIKTPIAAMELLLQSGELDRELLRGELFSIEKYVDLVLTYQRLGSDTTDLVLQPCALDDIVRGAVKAYARLFILKKLTLSFTPTGRTVLTDEKWLGFVIGQILSNALKYTNRGGVTIWGEGDRLLLEDTGIGIPESELPRVFERSFTGMNGRENQRTTGLGLYLCKGACDLLGHGIRIESKVGRGTRVILDLSRSEGPKE